MSKQTQTQTENKMISLNSVRKKLPENSDEVDSKHAKYLVSQENFGSIKEVKKERSQNGNTVGKFLNPKDSCPLQFAL